MDNSMSKMTFWVSWSHECEDQSKLLTINKLTLYFVNCASKRAIYFLQSFIETKSVFFRQPQELILKDPLY